ncbi:MAG TPA: LysM peptidoglycan-binding domain-containing protein, partial [Longimicrobiaceae bacterium]|nr:LysM peptidoglycan-binding domain-containing protein [Longimicrobiaceae bacterium]
QTILRAGLSGVSFGDIVEYLVGLVDPQLGFRLPAPWDVLYQLRFDDLKLEVNFATRAVGIRYEPFVNLGIARVDAISLTYLKRAGRSTVDIAIEGGFLGQEYGEKDPLAWDLLNDPPPAPPGKGDQLLELRYLGLGQNVTFRETRSFRRVRDVMEALEADFAEVPDDRNPLASLPALKFSGDGSWLVGADFTLMSAVSLMGVFNDPVLYGLRVGLAGPKVKSLAGLEFEILYKKVTDTVGVYSLELTLPDAMRQLQFGAVAVTVPIIGIDIYTNGNFRLDLGFPANRDFSRSFCVQGGPFVGYGGFYFALLDGATSEVVPRVRNGSFAPVIEAGLGLSIGVGRTLEKGVLRAGATLTVQAIIEGALGWFNPDDRAQPSDLFYRLQGTASIVGKVYGEVDFVVVKARVSITAYAAVTLTLQAYAPIVVRLELGVEVSASVTILFIELTFSFEAKLDLSFQIGEGGGAPWLPAEEDPREHPLRLGGQRRRFRAPAPAPLELFRLVRERVGEAPEFDWSPRAVFVDGAPVPVDVLLVPSLTPAIPSRVTHALRAGPATPSGDPEVQVVMALFVPTSVPAGARHAHEVLRVEHETAEDVAFNRLAAGVLRWAVSSLRAAPDAHVFRGSPAAAGETVTAAALEAIACFLADRANREATFTYERVTGLVERNFVLRLSSPVGPTGAFHDPRSDAPRPADAPPVQGAVFPMIPEVRMAPQGHPAVDFWRHACADAGYRAFLAAYYDQLTPGPPAGVPRDPFERDPCPRPGSAGPTGLASAGPLRSTPLPEGCTDGREPLSATLFADYFAMLAQQAVQAAADLMAAYPYEPTGEETLWDVVRAFGGVRVEYAVRPGDTPGTVAARFGVPVAEVRRHNPWLADAPHAERLPHGSVLALEAGPTVARTAAANADYPLRPGAKLTVRHVRYAVQAKDTLASVAHAFALAGPQALVLGEAAVNAANPGLLRAGAELPVPPADYAVDADDLGAPDGALDRIAAGHFVRAGLRAGGAEVEARLAWYASAIGRLSGGAFRGAVHLPVAELAGDPPQLRDTGRTFEYVVRATDTVAGVAAMLELLQLSPADPAWTGYRGRVTVSPAGPLQPGSTVHLPALGYRLRAGDTLAGLARTFLAPRAETAPSGAVEALARSAGSGELLAPRAVLALPEVRYPVLEGDTLGSVAARFDQTVEELAQTAEDDPGILAPGNAARRMAVPDVAARPVDELVRDLARFGRFNALSTTLSRFLMNGMRAPVPPADGPVPPDAPLWGLYDVAGQQFPAPGPSAPTGPYEIDFSKAPGATAPWFCFDPPPGGRAAAAGECADSLRVTLPEDFFQRHRPAAELEPLLATGPAPMRLYDLVAPRHALEQVLPWQPASRVPLPGPSGPTGPSGQVSGAAGAPSLWVFPQTLLRDLAAGPTGVTAGTRPYELLAARDAGGGATTETPLGAYAWATAVPLRVVRALDERGAFVPGTYELAGADPDGRDRLLKAWRYLDASPGHDDRLYLLYRPGGADANRSGLVSDLLSAGRTLLLKTNLSTETHSGARLLAGAPGEFHAPLASPGDFLRYAWEASITGTGGFLLAYAATDGAALPDELFAADGSATLWAVLLLDRQSRPGAPERALYPFNNCAVLAENLDASAVRVVARLRDPLPDQRVRVAAVPPGVVGFGLARHNPHGASGPTGLTQRLHSLVGYRVRAGDDFAESHEGLPVGPLDREPAWMGLPPKGPTAHAYWAYEQVIPIARFGAVNDCPASPALPPAADNPYRGVTGPSEGSSRPLGAARVGLAYHDVYGNETRATRPLPDVELPVGYTDDLVGVAAWPGAAFDYRFAPGPTGGIQLDTRLSLQVERYLPGQGTGYEAAVRAASADAERYGQLFYQVQQRDVEFALASSLGTPRVAEAGELKAPLSAFVTRARVFAAAASTLRQAAHRTPGGETLAALAASLAVPPGELLAANRDADAAALFPATWVRPHLVPAPAMNTLDALARDVGARRTGWVPGRDPCAGVSGGDDACAERPPALRLVLPGEEARSFRAAPRVAAGEPDPEAVAHDNSAQPLTPGTVLRTRTLTSPPLDFAHVPDSLDGVAQWLGCAAYAEVPDPAKPDGPPLGVGLLVENWKAEGIVADGVSVSVGGATHVTRDDTFARVYDALAAQLGTRGLPRGDFAGAVRALPGMLVAGKTLAYATLVVPQPAPSPLPGPAAPTFALRDVPEAAGTTGELAGWNRATPGFFATGAPLLLGFDCCKAGEHDTLGTLADDARITPEQLAAFNLGVELGAGVELAVPGLVRLSDPDAVWAAYAPRAEDSLASIAAALGVGVRELADANRQLPGVFAPGAAVRAGGAERWTGAMDSLESMWQKFGGPDWGEFGAFAEALGDQSGIYSRSGAWVGPLPRVPDEGGASPALEAVAARLNVEPATLLLANRALRGLLREGATVLGPDAPGGEQTSAEVGPFDTVETVRRRLREQLGPDAPLPTYEKLAELNRGSPGLLTVGARLLLPPDPTTVALPFDARIPAGAGEDSVVFPVHVTVAVTRAPGLVHPDFRDAEAVRRAESRLAPRVSGGADAGLSLAAFAQSFEAAFEHPHRLKCAVAAGAEGKSGAAGEVWAVNFGPAGIRRMEVDASRPRFYALRPLSTETVGGEVQVPVYTSGHGLCGSALKRFEGVDLDVWMRQLLEAVDLYLTPPYAAPSFRMGLTGAAAP